MLAVCLHWNRSRRVFAGLLATLAALLALHFCTARAGARPKRDAATPQQREAFLQQLGFAVSEVDAQVRTLMIPETFNDVYAAYNALQREAGYDLTPYRGKTVTQYTYPVPSASEERDVHLLVLDGAVIGGDVCSPALDGSMAPLCRQEGTDGNPTSG